jgi:hypothetical protein
MIIIYVKKSWLDEIASEHFIVGDRAKELVRLYASKINVVYPFVLADIARSEEGKHGEMFLPSHIPLDVVRGIFDMTEAEKKRLGFFNSESSPES